MRSQNNILFLSAMVMSTILSMSCHRATRSNIPQSPEKEVAQEEPNPSDVEDNLEGEIQEPESEVDDAKDENDNTSDRHLPTEKISNFHLVATELNDEASCSMMTLLSKLGQKTFLYTSHGWFAEIVGDKIIPRPKMSKGLNRTDSCQSISELAGNTPNDIWLIMSDPDPDYISEDSSRRNWYHWDHTKWKKTKQFKQDGISFASQPFEKGYLKFGKTILSEPHPDGVDFIDISFFGNSPSHYSLTNSMLQLAQNPFQGEIEIRSIQATASDESGNIYIFGNACSGDVSPDEVREFGSTYYKNVHCFPSVSHWKPGWSKAVVSRLPDLLEQESPAWHLPKPPVFLFTQDTVTFFSTTIRESNEKPYGPDMITPYLAKWDGASWKRIQVPIKSEIIDMELALDKGFWFAFENGELWHYSINEKWKFIYNLPMSPEFTSASVTVPSSALPIDSFVETSPGNIWILSGDGNLYHNKPHKKMFRFDPKVFPNMDPKLKKD